MQPVGITRRERLSLLLSRYKTQAEFNEAIGLDKTDATISQIKNQSPHYKTKKPRVMGDELARKIELRLGLAEGWMDTPVDAYLDENSPPELAKRIFLSMEPEAQYQALKVLDVLVQPKKMNGGN